jgi:hypothetical protein
MRKNAPRKNYDVGKKYFAVVLIDNLMMMALKYSRN